jgi:hypothetical protein
VPAFKQVIWGCSHGKPEYLFSLMLRPFLNWRTLMAFIAILIVSGTILYSKYLADKIKKDEQQKVALWIEALKFLSNPNHGRNVDVRLASMVAFQKGDIPIIETNEKDIPSGLFVNVDSAKAAADPQYLKQKISEFKASHDPVIVPITSSTYNKYYYGDSKLLQEVRYYPLVQLFIVGLFILITILALRTGFRSAQNHLWAGMAKETAHQLGTPVSSLEGWVEILKETHGNEAFLPEIEKDVTRLRLVSDRFGKIGSTPQLEEKNIVCQVEDMVEYMRKRAGGRVRFETHAKGRQLNAKISAPLFDWVIENLLKNALDAMEGKGLIKIEMVDLKDHVVIDISDTGKGISKQNIAKVFKPGFTTKKRGWGLGLSLSKRIIEQYHKGTLNVKSSEPGKGTTFRIVLKK